MSNRKRSQESQGFSDTDHEDASSDRSFLSLQTRKRPRVSDFAEFDRSNHSIAFSDIGGDTERAIRSSTVDLEQDEEELELLATQIIQEKYSFGSDEPNAPSEHGILERVECYNFMCHDHFQVELGPLINFIVGKNGSGKSAVLTAITLCLGGKASTTNRGQSLKSFIKEGKE
jgi:ATP-dependent RNA helicase DDX6/DHH1